MSRSGSHVDWQRRRRPSSLLAGMPSASDGVWKSSPQFGRRMKESRSACRASPPQASCLRICFVFPPHSSSLFFCESFASPVCRNRYKLSGVWWCGKTPEYQNYQGWVRFYGLVSSCSAAGPVCVCMCVLYCKIKGGNLKSQMDSSYLHEVVKKSTQQKISYCRHNVLPN